MRQLKVHVERIVRPIRASGRRKDRTREELLAHLLRAVDEEGGQGANEDRAMARAIERLGPPEVIRRELQASVPPLDRIFHVTIPFANQLDALWQRLGKRKGESVIHHALRTTVWATLACLIADSILMGVVSLAPNSPSASDALQVFIAWHGPVIACWFFYVLALHGFRRATASHSFGWRNGLQAVACCTAAAAVTMVAGFLISRCIGLLADHWHGFLGHHWRDLVSLAAIHISLLAPWAIVLLGWKGAVAQRRYEEWGSLAWDE